MIMAFLLQYPAEHLPAPWIIVSGCEASRWTTTCKSFSFKAPKRYVGVSLWNSQREHYYWTLLFFTSQKFHQTCPWFRSNEITKAMKTEYWLESGSLPLPLEMEAGCRRCTGSQTMSKVLYKSLLCFNQTSSKNTACSFLIPVTVFPCVNTKSTCQKPI